MEHGEILGIFKKAVQRKISPTGAGVIVVAWLFKIVFNFN